eukprot:gene16540-18869_t
MLVAANNAKFAEVDEAIVVAALNGNASFPSNHSVKLRSLTSKHLCQLFDHCYLYNLGIHLEDGIDSVEDLTDLGLDKLNAKVLLKRIAEWKTRGLPEDLDLKSPLEPALESSIITALLPVVAETSNPDDAKVDLEKELDDNYISAQWRYCQESTNRIFAAAEAGSHLAQAYLSILYDREGTLVQKNLDKAAEYATRALPYLEENSIKDNMYAQFNFAMCYVDGRGVGKDENEAVRNVWRAADQNHAGSQHMLGLCYSKGTGVAQDEIEAVKYYTLAAEQGHVRAQYSLGTKFASGTGVTKNVKEAARFYKLAADQGDTDAQYAIGKALEFGIGINKNAIEATRYYKLAADRGMEHAQFRLALCYDDGFGVTKNEKEAARYYKLAADQGNAGAQFNLAFSYEEGSGLTRDEKEAFRYFKLAADQSDMDAQFQVGIHLEDGIENIRDLTDLGLDRLNAKVLLKRIDAWKVEGVPTDFSSTNSTSHFRSGNSSAVTISTTSNDCADAALVQKQLDDDFSAANYCCDRAATDRITAAAEAGDPLAQAYLSILHDKEENLVEKDRTRAVEYATRSLLWLKENASSGNAFALYNLAMCYADGRGVSENEKEAVRYARLAADQNHAGAQNFLGFCFDTGKGVIIDHYEAVRYFKLAADQGRSVGQYNLGLSYSEGKGVTRDEKEAARYFKLAADQGDSWAQYQLGLCYENGAGVTINKQEALRYYKLAADNEHKSAQLRLQNLSHDATAISDSKYVMTNG